jgi:hypothetical protein
MTGYQLLEKLQNLTSEDLQKDVWFTNEDCTSKVQRVFIEDYSTYGDAEYGEVIYEGDYTEEEIKEMCSCGDIIPLTKKGDIILTD